MPEKLQHRHFIFIAIYLAVLAGFFFKFGFVGQALWAIPLVLAFFFLAYHFDVKLPTVGRMNADHVIAFPAVVLLQDPLLVGLLAAVAALGDRLYQRGAKGLKPVTFFDGANAALTITLSGWLFLRLSEGLEPSSLLWFPYLLAVMILFYTINVLGYALSRVLTGVHLQWAFIRKALLQGWLWAALSLPLVALVVMEIRARNPTLVVLGCIPLLVIVWALHLNGGLEEKNLALVQATRRQEFLQQLTMTHLGSLENEAFLDDLLKGLKEFVPWDRALLLVLPAPEAEQPFLHSLEGLPENPHGVKDALLGLLDDAALREPRVTQGDAVRPLLSGEAQCQIVVALATTEVAFGLLVAERNDAVPFQAGDAAFLNMAFMQIASHVQDEILKKQLLATNRKLMHQADYLSQILDISNLLRVHLDVQGILEKVAQGIREGIGFESVLVSLFHEEEGFFERVAQAGDDERWEEIRAVRPPAQDILRYMQEKHRAGACYLVRHTEEMPSPFAVLPRNPRPTTDLDDWHPEDLLLVPLTDKDDHLLGIISVDEPSDGKVPSMETLRALEVLANQTVHALERAQVHAQIKRQAVLDGLTGLYNHGYFQETLAAKAREHLEARQPYAVLMMDLDNFKDVNDTFGHLAGDFMLRAVADSLTSSIRKEDVAARYGGEEFSVFLPRRTGEQAMLVAERIRAAVDQIRAVVPGAAAPLRVTISVGLAAFPEQGGDHHQVLEQADLALYQAKRQGKNRVCQVLR